MAPNAPRITYYVVLFQLPPDTGSAIRPISRLLQEDEEKVREKLLTHTFEVLSRYARKPNAEGLKNQLHALGIDTTIVSDQDLRGHLIVSASTANKGQGGIAFRDFDEKPLYVDYKDIAGAAMMEVPREDGSTTTLIDLHRFSTSITPRVDVALFDFPTLMGNPEAGLEDFLKELEIRSEIKVDRRFNQHREAILRASKDFGSKPVEFAPTKDRLAAPYDKEIILGADIWSFLLCTKIREESQQ